MVMGNLKDIEERHKVVPVIHERLGDRFAYSLECGKMDYCIDLMLVEDTAYSCNVAAVNLIKRDLCRQH